MSQNTERQLQVLLDAGIDPSVAESMLQAMTKAEDDERKKAQRAKKYFANHNSRKMIEVPVVVEKTCMTCGTVTSHKTIKKVWSDTAEDKHTSICNLCENCIRLLETMSKEELISLFIIQNHPLMELRQIGNAQQIKLAKRQPAIKWLTTRMPNGIPTGKKDEEGFVDMPDVKLWRK